MCGSISRALLVTASGRRCFVTGDEGPGLQPQLGIACGRSVSGTFGTFADVALAGTPVLDHRALDDQDVDPRVMPSRCSIPRRGKLGFRGLRAPRLHPGHAHALPPTGRLQADRAATSHLGWRTPLLPEPIAAASRLPFATLQWQSEFPPRHDRRRAQLQWLRTSIQCRPSPSGLWALPSAPTRYARTPPKLW